MPRQFLAQNTVGKAMSRDDRKTLSAAGVGAAGLGVVRGGAEYEYRARQGVQNAQQLVRTRQQNLANAARDLAAAPSRGEAVNRYGIRRYVPVGQRRQNIGNLEQGVRQAERKVAARGRLLAPRIRRARQVKAGGLGLALGGGIAATHYFRQANRNRALNGY